MGKDSQDWALEFNKFLEPRWNDFWLVFDAQGKMSRYEFGRFLQSHNYSGDERAVFDFLDSDSSGVISTKEMLKFRQKISLAQRNETYTASDFKILAKRVYSSLFHLFRKMDTRNKNYIFKAEFCRECINLGFRNSLSVWNELSLDGKIIDLQSFDPQAANAFRLFARAIFAKHRTLSECWKWTINAGKSPRIGISEFLRAVQTLSVNESMGKFLFDCLEENKAVQEKTFMEVMKHWEDDTKREIEESRNTDRMDLNISINPVTPKTQTEFISWASVRWDKIQLVFRKKAEIKRLEFEEHLRSLGYPYDEKAATSLLALEENMYISYRRFQQYKQEIKRLKDVAAYTQVEFYSLVKRRFNSLIRAWRLMLDPMNDGKIGKNSFYTNCHQIGFKGDVRTLFFALSRRSRTPGFVDLAGFDPATFEELTRFALMIFDMHSNLNDAWRWSINTEKGTQISLETFTRYCNENGFRGNTRKVFRALDKSNEQFLTRDGFDLLRHWDPSLPSMHKDAKLGKLSLGRELAAQRASGTPGRNRGDDNLESSEVFAFEVVLGPAEYAEFLRKRANLRQVDGSAWQPKDVRPNGLTVHSTLGMIPKDTTSLEGLIALT